MQAYSPKTKLSLLSLSSTCFLHKNFVVVWVITEEAYRSSRPEVFCKKGVLRNFTKFGGKHFSQRLFFNKVAGLGLQLY